MPADETFLSGYPFLLLNGQEIANPSRINFIGSGGGLKDLPEQNQVDVDLSTISSGVQVVSTIGAATSFDGAQALVETGIEQIRMTYSDSEGKWISDNTQTFVGGVLGATVGGVLSVGGTYYSVQVSDNVVAFASFNTFSLEEAHDAGLEPEFRLSLSSDQIAAQTMTLALITHVGDNNTAVATTSALFGHTAITGVGGGTVIMNTGTWVASPTHAAVKHNLLMQPQAATSAGTNGNVQGSSIEVRWVNGDITT